MPHFSPEFWAHCFDGVALTIIMWIGRAIWWAIKQGNKEMVGLVDSRARIQVDLVRAETKSQLAQIEARFNEQDEKMDQHEVKDQSRHNDVMALIAKTQSA